ncbi:hypothetical protein BU17DRAFT_81530 [Hysterangium stoloniferum]|nr:hypothetical protein BU17DRAFT_81530 [Hysterangium stoloniferum]
MTRTVLSSASTLSTLRLRKRGGGSEAFTSQYPMDKSKSSTRSQLPSPASSLGDDGCYESARSVEQSFETSTAMPPRSDIKVRSKRMRKAQERETDTRMDLPLGVALVPPLGYLLTGGDFFKDFVLLLLLFFYLHQLIKLPWELYLASSPRGKRLPHVDASPEQRRLYDLAESELKKAELAYLAFSVLTPLLGAALLRYVGTALTGKDYISWFSTGVFVLVTGIRPWRHLAHRLLSRTDELQDSIAAFRTKGVDMSTRILQLEEEVAELRKEFATKQDVQRLKREFELSLDMMDTSLGRHEHVVEDQQNTMDGRLAALEQAVGEALKDSMQSFKWTLTSPSKLFTHTGPFPLKRRISVTAKSKGDVYTSAPKTSTVAKESSRRTRVSKIMRTGHGNGMPGRLLDLILFPFGVGRRLLWALVDLVQRGLV